MWKSTLILLCSFSIGFTATDSIVDGRELKSCNTQLAKLMELNRYPQVIDEDVTADLTDLEIKWNDLILRCDREKSTTMEMFDNYIHQLNHLLHSADLSNWSKLSLWLKSIILFSAPLTISDINIVQQQGLRSYFSRRVETFASFLHERQEQFVKLLQWPQRPEIVELITQITNYRDAAVGFHAVAMPLYSTDELKKINHIGDQIALMINTFELFLNSPKELNLLNYQVMAEIGLLISALCKLSPYDNYRKALGMKVLQIPPVKQLSISSAQLMVNIGKVQRLMPDREALMELLQKTLHRPDINPIFSLYFLQNDPHYFGIVKRSLVDRRYNLSFGNLYRKSKGGAIANLLDTFFFLNKIDDTRKLNVDPRKIDGGDIPVGLIIPDSGDTLRQKISSDITFFQIVVSGQQYLYLPNITGTYARQFIFSMISNLTKTWRKSKSRQLKEVMKFRLLLPQHTTSNNISMQDLHLMDGPDLLRSLLGINEKPRYNDAVFLGNPYPLNDWRSKVTVAIESSKIQRVSPLILIKEWEKMADSDFIRGTQAWQKIADLAKKINRQSDQIYTEVIKIYKEIMDFNSGIAHLVNQPISNRPGRSWSDKIMMVDQYPMDQMITMLMEAEK